MQILAGCYQYHAQNESVWKFAEARCGEFMGNWVNGYFVYVVLLLVTTIDLVTAARLAHNLKVDFLPAWGMFR